MNRRDLIKNIAIISGGLFVGSNFLLTSCKRDDAGALVLSEDLMKLLTEISDTIIPETETVGAKAVDSAEFIKKVFQDIYSEKEQQDFINALHLINDEAKKTEGKEFVELNAQKEQKFLTRLKIQKIQDFCRCIKWCCLRILLQRKECRHHSVIHLYRVLNTERFHIKKEIRCL
ncbi:gluconate 2-dehydrogenase subunit 3 family protein [Flavobacterium nitratireducens]|uniref:gluconate 2-dehydrogenase subunit 3 family protein n=1 Tax=Flavobacterium nitratireducens TaxID=992289 RepID=UPI0024159628|nr:gluconate 2-dehydrogenase subunit 3 family protein [Flavobacterium nitratireducens]